MSLRCPIMRPSPNPMEETSMFNRLQSLFDRLAGISRHQASLLAQAQSIFAPDERGLAALDTPACWRRPARVRRGQRRR